MEYPNLRNLYGTIPESTAEEFKECIGDEVNVVDERRPMGKNKDILSKIKNTED